MSNHYSKRMTPELMLPGARVEATNPQTWMGVDVDEQRRELRHALGVLTGQKIGRGKREGVCEGRQEI